MRGFSVAWRVAGGGLRGHLEGQVPWRGRGWRRGAKLRDVGLRPAGVRSLIAQAPLTRLSSLRSLPLGHAAHSVDEHAGSVARLTTEHGAAELDPSDPGQV